MENSPNHHGGVLGVDDEREADIEEEVDEDDDDEVNSTQVEKVKLITPQKTENAIDSGSSTIKHSTESC